MKPSWLRAVAVSPVARAVSARSPDSTGHRWPEPVLVVGQGWPSNGHEVASGVQQSP